MQVISHSISTLSKGSGSNVTVINKEYCKVLKITGGKGSKIKQTLVLDDDGKFKVIIEKAD